MSNYGQQRRECREPHSFLESTYLENSASPRLNNLNQGSRRGRNNDTTASSVFNRFSSVSPHQAGVSYNSNSGLYGGVGYSVPPPLLNVFPGCPNTSNSLDWPLPPQAAAAAWTMPRDVPWIPPPMISQSDVHPSANIGRNSATMGGGVDGGVRWPSPKDVPLPSMFPFPPYLLPPFPPLPPNVDLSQLPPPPPPLWFTSPVQEPHGGVMDDDSAEEGSSTRDSSVKGYPLNRRRMPVSYPKRYTREPSMSAREQHRMRSIAKEAKRDLHHQLSRSVSVDSQHKNNEIEMKQRQRWQSPRCISPRGKGTPTPRAMLSSVKRFTSPSSRGITTTSAPLSRPNSGRRNDYYTAARALKGVSPRLEDVMRGRSSSGGIRLISTSRKEGNAHHHHYREERERKQRQHLAKIDDADGMVPAPYHGSDRRDGRTDEYVKGIEDLYRRLRSSYEEFQRDPSSFVRNTSALKEAATAMAPPLHSLVDDTNVHGTRGNTGTSKPRDEDHKTAQLKDLGHPSEESQRIRDELLKLEMQWQRLEELKRGSTGECGVAPVEFTQQDPRWIPPKGETHTSSARSSNQSVNVECSRSQKAKGQITATGDTLRGESNGLHSTHADGVKAVKGATGMRSHNSSLLSQGDTLQGPHLDDTQAHQRDHGSSNRGLFTRELVLGLVRDRKAMLE